MSAYQNISIALIALVVPLVAELISPETGAGLDALLYWPFDFAYALVIGVMFLASNILGSPGGPIVVPISVGLAFWLGWFVLAFLAVGQLHLSLGYQL
jgi:hypothetical protein